MKCVRIRASDKLLLLWLYKKANRGFALGSVYEIPLGYYGLKVPKDDDGTTIYQGNKGKIKRGSALYVVKISPFEPLGWGIGSLPCVTSDGKITTVGVNGNFRFDVELPQLLYERTLDMGDMVSLESFRERIVSDISGVIRDSFAPSTVRNVDDVARAIHNCHDKISDVFSSFGLKLVSFVVEGIN
ncbi:MAG: hypothetical protein FWB78_01905 [Treponema sp.]|nr:hypothetical protein [Treponema sp.]